MTDFTENLTPSADSLSKFRLFILALGLGAALQLIGFLFAYQVSDPLYRASYWTVYHNVNFAEITDAQLKLKTRENQIVDMLFSYLYLSGGLIFSLTIIKWAPLRLRLLAGLLLFVAVIFVRFKLAGSVFD